MMIDWVGWLATAVFASSYLFKAPGTLRRVQAAAALLWVTYGVVIHATPVVVANLVVAGAALYSAMARSPAAPEPDATDDSSAPQALVPPP
jgi:hypothetical protein